VLRLFTREDMLSYEIIEDYLDQIDHPQFLASVEFFFKKDVMYVSSEPVPFVKPQRELKFYVCI